MEKEILEKYLEAGKIAAAVREKSRAWIKPGVRLLDIAEKIENKIKELGGHPAFPVNLSLNEAAAHYTPTRNDETMFTKNDILKVDIGVHIDGYVGDTAYTIAFDKKFAKLIAASEKALEEVLKLCVPGEKISNISAVIEKTIKNMGFNPINNLTGHGLRQYELHTEPQVPNVKFESDYKLEEDLVIAIEPFATDGSGSIKDSEPTVIFSIAGTGPVRNPDARVIMKFAERFMHLSHGDIKALPFAERWIPIESRIKIRLAMRELVSRGIAHEYPVLKEVSSGMVSQAEHTVIVKDDPVVTTQLKEKRR